MVINFLNSPAYETTLTIVRENKLNDCWIYWSTQQINLHCCYCLLPVTKSHHHTCCQALISITWWSTAHPDSVLHVSCTWPLNASTLDSETTRAHPDGHKWMRGFGLYYTALTLYAPYAWPSSVCLKVEPTHHCTEQVDYRSLRAHVYCKAYICTKSGRNKKSRCQHSHAEFNCLFAKHQDPKPPWGHLPSSFHTTCTIIHMGLRFSAIFQ